MKFTSHHAEARGKLLVAGLSLRFQVAGYLLLVAGEVASSHGFPEGITTPKKKSSSRVQLSLAFL